MVRRGPGPARVPQAPLRSLIAVVLVAAMAGFGFGVYHFLGNLRSQALNHKVRAPHNTQFSLPGTLVVEQGGALYRLQQGTFTQIANGGWMQPAVTPDHRNLVAVKRTANSSDLYELNLNGQVERQLTNDGSSTVELNHWAFYPNVSPDGGTIFYSWDEKDQNGQTFRVDLSVYAQPLGGSQSQADSWTVPNFYTGGDVQPVYVAGGGIIYSKYDITAQGQHFSQLWLTTQAMATGQALTAPEDDCSQPAVSPDGNKVAMICTSGGQVARLEVASLTNGALGTPAVVAQGTIADPAWGPDGKSLVYLSAVPPDGTFQLFYLNLAPPPAPKAKPAPTARSGKPATSPTAAAPPTPYPPKQLTLDNDFDATSAPVWFS